MLFYVIYTYRCIELLLSKKSAALKLCWSTCSKQEWYLFTSFAMASDCKLQRARIRSHSSLHITSQRDTFHIQTLGVIAINMVSKQRGGMLSGRDNRTKIRQFSIISTLLYRLYKYIHISFIFNKILYSPYPFAFTLNLLE